MRFSGKKNEFIDDSSKLEWTVRQNWISMDFNWAYESFSPPDKLCY